jgi:hypothetical protein
MAYYELGVTHNIRVTEYKKYNTWDEVIDYLRNHIPSWTVCITICKRYPCGKLIASRSITMGELYEVASSPTDKVLKQ